MAIHTPPIPNAYWVEPGRLMAGGYPDGPDEVKLLLEAGVTFFADLTEMGEATLYAWQLGEAAEYHRMPIPDFSVPTPEQMVHILDTIDAALEAGHIVYVHCWFGLGRTGTVVGCYLVRHEMSGEEALAALDQLRAGTLKAGMSSPISRVQYLMVKEWRE